MASHKGTPYLSWSARNAKAEERRAEAVTACKGRRAKGWCWLVHGRRGQKGKEGSCQTTWPSTSDGRGAPHRALRGEQLHHGRASHPSTICPSESSVTRSPLRAKRQKLANDAAKLPSDLPVEPVERGGPLQCQGRRRGQYRCHGSARAVSSNGAAHEGQCSHHRRAFRGRS